MEVILLVVMLGVIVIFLWRDHRRDKWKPPSNLTCEHLHFELRPHGLIAQGYCLGCKKHFDLRIGFRSLNWALVKCEAVLEKGTKQ